MKRNPLLLLLAVMLMAGCSSRPAIPVSEQQSLVMESSVLVAGISAEKPDISSVDGATVSRSGLYNEQVVPVTINYRFYWYDVKGPGDPSARTDAIRHYTGEIFINGVFNGRLSRRA